MPGYLERKLLAHDPFLSLDDDGVGRLVRIAIDAIRATGEPVDIAVCGEHGGDPRSIALLRRAGVDEVSCSPRRVPVARLAAAHAALADDPGRDR